MAVIAGLVVIGVAFNAASIPHPMSMYLLGVLLPLALFAERMVTRRAPAVTA
ncbi:MAG: hypothetical protein M3485_08420 [Pseudomonadota bacterium]|nr:hypothetical protein [Pseudomonadota bacterium]